MSKSNYTVLIIDYDPRNIETVRNLMERAGCNVEVAQDGVAGLQAFARLKPDLVLIEAMLPKKHGFEVCQDIKKSSHGKNTPVVITTAVYRGRKYRTQALHIYGCDEYLEKPLQEDKLLETCQEVLGRVGKSLDKQAAKPLAKSHTDPHSANKKKSKTKMPTAVVDDLTEEEIMARLDALMPGEELPEASVVAAPAADASDASVGGGGDSPGETVQTPGTGEVSEDDSLQTGHVIHQVDGSTAPDPAYEPESVRDEAVDDAVDDAIEKPEASSQVVPFEDKRGRNRRRTDDPEAETEPGDTMTEAPAADLESELEEITAGLADSVPDPDEVVSPAVHDVAPADTVEDDIEVVEDDTDTDERAEEIEETREAEVSEQPADEDEVEQDVDVAVAEILEENGDDSETVDAAEAVAEPESPAAVAASAFDEAEEDAGAEAIDDVDPPEVKSSRSTMIWLVVVIMVVVGAAVGAYFLLPFGNESLPGFGSATEETSSSESTTSRPAAILPPVTPPSTTREIDPTLDGETARAGVEPGAMGAGMKTAVPVETSDATPSGSDTPTTTKPPSPKRASTAPVEKTQTPKPQPTRSETRPAAKKTAPTAAASKPKPAATRTPEPAKTEPATSKTESAPSTVGRDSEPEPVFPSATQTKVVEPPASPARKEPEPEPVIEDSPAVKAKGELVAMATPNLSDPPSLPGSTQNTKPAIESPAPIVQEEPEPPPAPKKASVGDLIEIQNLDTAPSAVDRSPPVYPPIARRAGHEGTVILNILIDEKGRVAEMEMIKGVGREDMDEAARDAVRQWTFKPGTKDGVPVKVWKIEKVVFKL
jgi:TonB family protein